MSPAPPASSRQSLTTLMYPLTRRAVPAPGDLPLRCDADGPSRSHVSLLLVVQLDSERRLDRAAADRWFCGEQQSPPALLLVVRRLDIAPAPGGSTDRSAQR